MAVIAASRQIQESVTALGNDDNLSNDKVDIFGGHLSKASTAFFGKLRGRMESSGSLQEGRESPRPEELLAPRGAKDLKTGLPLSIVVKSKILAERVKKKRKSREKIILPDSNVKRIWDAFVGLMVLYSVVVVPLRVGFDVPLETYTEALWEFIVDFVFISDMALTFFEGYITNDGELITNRSKIRTNYLKGWFIIDFLSSMPLDIVLGLVTGGVKSCDPFPLCGPERGNDGNLENLDSLKLFKTLKLVRLLKLTRLFKLVKLATSEKVRENVPANLMLVLSLLFKIVYAAHFIACFWYWTSGLSEKDRIDNGDNTIIVLCEDEDANKKSNWVTTVSYQNFDLCGVAMSRSQYLTSHYITSVYWTIATMMSVGYGDIYAQNPVEQLFSILVQIIGAFLFGMIIATVTTIIQNQNPRQSTMAKKIEEMKQYTADRRLSKELQKRIQLHYEYYFTHKSVFNSREILKATPMHMQSEVVMFMYEDTIAKIHFFQHTHEGHLDTPFIVDTVHHLLPFFEAAGAIVVQEGETIEDMLFLTSGTMEFYCSVDVHPHMVKVVKNASKRGSTIGRRLYHALDKYGVREKYIASKTVLHGFVHEGYHVLSNNCIHNSITKVLC